MRKTLAGVWTMRAIADRIQIMTIEYLPGSFGLRACGQPLLYPRRKFSLCLRHRHFIPAVGVSLQKAGWRRTLPDTDRLYRNNAA
jgi:hypothetical protein